MSCNNNRCSGGNQTFWIIVIVALVLIWLNYVSNGNGCGSCGNGCNDDCGCFN